MTPTTREVEELTKTFAQEEFLRLMRSANLTGAIRVLAPSAELIRRRAVVHQWATRSSERPSKRPGAAARK